MNSKKKQWDKRCPAYFSYDGPIRSWSVEIFIEKGLNLGYGKNIYKQID